MARNTATKDYSFGERFGRWTVLREAPKKGARRAWLCVCDCGNSSDVIATNLRRGTSTQCKKCSSEDSAEARERANTKHGNARRGKKTREYSAASYHKRRARKAENGGQATAEQIVSKYEYHGNKCIYCGTEDNLTLEHRKPISRGGSHHPANIAPACRWCNTSKGNKTEAEYLEYLNAK